MNLVHEIGDKGRGTNSIRNVIHKSARRFNLCSRKGLDLIFWLGVKILIYILAAGLPIAPPRAVFTH